MHADLTEHCGGHLNDLVVDELAAPTSGNFGFDLMNFADPAGTSLVRVDPDGSVHVEADDLWFPNGTVIDGDTLIVGETFAGRLTAFTIAADGSLTTAASGARSRRPSSPAPVDGDAPALASLPTAAARRRGPHLGGRRARRADRAGSRPAARSSRRSSCPRVCGRLRACSAGRMGGRCCCAAAPDFIEANRKDVREAVLLTTTVDVPHGGRP